MNDAFEIDACNIDWLLAELEDFQQELRKAQNERVSSNWPFNFFHFINFYLLM